MDSYIYNIGLIIYNISSFFYKSRDYTDFNNLDDYNEYIDYNNYDPVYKIKNFNDVKVKKKIELELEYDQYYDIENDKFL